MSTGADFLPGDRASGILLHVTSLPSPHGIGDLGPSAFDWVNRLARAGQSWWQALPLGPTGYGNSPYQPLSSFAGNVLLISPDHLIRDGLLRPGDLDSPTFPTDHVDFPAVMQFKHRLLERAWSNFEAGARPDLIPAFDRFRNDQAHWLDDYALFRALKARHGDVHYLEWPAALVQRDPEALDKARRELADAIGLSKFAQFLLFGQGARLKEYAKGRGVRFIGDLPFFVSPDSSDVWANPEYFQLDERGRPRFVAGVPPDYFSPQGQLWGNPVYDWNALRLEGYRWWVDRLRALLAHVDVVRLDHFRGFAAAWHVPAGSASAESGRWLPGPGTELFRATREALGRLPLIAEDLGVITPDVRRLREEFGLPGMKVLQFAFDGQPDNPFLPENFGADAVVYTGTHDNDTTRGWYESLPEARERDRGELPRESGPRRRRRRLGDDPPGVVVAGQAGHGTAPGCPEPRIGGPHEPAREREGQLGLAIYRPDALGPRAPETSRTHGTNGTTAERSINGRPLTGPDRAFRSVASHFTLRRRPHAHWFQPAVVRPPLRPPRDLPVEDVRLERCVDRRSDCGTALKQIIYDGFREALADGVPAGKAGILVDEQFGSAILRDAAARGDTTALTVEKSGQDEFDFEYGEDFAGHIEAFHPTFCKVLVRYNPEGDSASNARQTARLKRLIDYLHRNRPPEPDGSGRLFMLELLVPPVPAQLDRVRGDRKAYDLEVRPGLMARSIGQLQQAGVEPDVWKLEGLDRNEDCERVAEVARQRGRDRVGCIVLGRGEDDRKVREWLTTAAAVPGYIGFAVGRTTFWDALTDCRAGCISRESAVTAIARRYREWVDLFESASSPKTEPVARSHPVAL